MPYFLILQIHNIEYDHLTSNSYISIDKMKLPFLLTSIQLLTTSIMLGSLMAFHNFSPSRCRHRHHRHYVSSTLLCISKNNKQSSKLKRKSSRVGDFWEARMDVWRPDVNDVERISWGKPAKKKGTGSRGVPHRLNLDERFLFDNARRKGFLEMEGSGWRSQRREAPLLNTYRSLCDARGQASIILHKRDTGIDELVCDLSPLRNPKIFNEVAHKCLELQKGGEIIFQGSGTDIIYDGNNDGTSTSCAEDLSMTLSIVDGGNNIENNEILDYEETGPWETRPIYQLPPFCISWELQRSDAKALGKSFAKLFQTKEEKVTSSKKPIGVKPGKSRRHGGYGIG
jgi:hypothetical protein